jgi:DNA-directed RNA polymerase II subunit RPB1
VNFWLFHNGFSIGIGNTIVGPKVMCYITQRIKKQLVAEIIEDAYHDRLKALPGMRDANTTPLTTS